MDPIGPGNHERAWNDPPKFAFNAGSGGRQGVVGGRRRLLNKRVPVHIGPTPPTITPAMKLCDTPPTKGSLPLCTPPLSSTRPPSGSLSTLNAIKENIRKVEDTRTPQEILHEVDLILNTSLQTFAETLKDNVYEEVVRRIAVMTGMWRDGRFSPVVQRRILAMVRALASGEHNTAWTLHQGLIVDYTSLCSPWMVGVKTLITEARASKGKKENKEADEEKVESEVNEKGETEENEKGERKDELGNLVTLKIASQKVVDEQSSEVLPKE